MKRFSRYFACAAVAAAGLALPASPLGAQERDRVDYKEVKRDDMPREVRHEADEQTRDAKDILYQRQTRDGKTFYSVHYTKDGKRMEVRLDESGKVVDGPHAAREQSGRRGDREADRDRDRDRDRETEVGGGRSKVYDKISEREVPRDVLRTMDQHTKGAKDLLYQRQNRPEGTFYSVHYTKDGKRMFVRVDDRGQLSVGPEVSDNRENPIERQPNQPAVTADWKREAISVDALPAEVRRTVEKELADGSGHSFIKLTRGGETRYLIEYDKAGRRESTIIASNGSLVEGEALAGDPASLKREAISVDDLPAAVRRTVEQQMADGSGHTFVRQTRGNETTYVIEYTKDGKRASSIVRADGKLVEGEALAGDTPRPTPPANPNPVPQADAQLAAGRELGSGAFVVLSSPDQLPAEVRTAINAELQGASDPLFQRFIQDGRTLYSVHFTEANGRRSFMAVDDKGKIAIKPRKSNAQEGGKGVRFEVVSGDQLPAEVRKEIESAAAGVDHLFLQRTEGDKRTYLVQFTNQKGDRQEVQVDASGKLIGKARNAREQPFTILDRKED